MNDIDYNEWYYLSQWIMDIQSVDGVSHWHTIIDSLSINWWNHLCRLLKTKYMTKATIEKHGKIRSFQADLWTKKLQAYFDNVTSMYTHLSYTTLQFSSANYFLKIIKLMARFVLPRGFSFIIFVDPLIKSLLKSLKYSSKKIIQYIVTRLYLTTKN